MVPGDIIGQRECGAISGWLGDHAEVVNTYNSGYVVPGAIDGNRTFARYNGSNVTFNNCFEVNGAQVTAADEASVGSGKLCYDINEGAGKVVFYQTLGTDLHPVLDASHGIVALENGQYVNVSDGVETAVAANSQTEAIYSINGVRQQQMVRGINIVRKSDGTIKKILIK